MESLSDEMLESFALNSDVDALINLRATSRRYRNLINDPTFQNRWLSSYGPPVKFPQLINVATSEQINFILKIQNYSFTLDAISLIFNRILQLDDVELFKFFLGSKYFNLELESFANTPKYQDNIVTNTNLVMQHEHIKEVVDIEEIRKNVILDLFLSGRLSFGLVSFNSINILRYLLHHQYGSHLEFNIKNMRSSYPPDRAITTFALVSRKQKPGGELFSIMLLLILRHDKIINPTFLDYIFNYMRRRRMLTQQNILIIIGSGIFLYIMEEISNLDFMKYLLDHDITTKEQVLHTIEVYSRRNWSPRQHEILNQLHAYYSL